MRFVGIAITTALACSLWAAKLEARPPETVTVKFPFAFKAGNQVLPAGTYKMEMLTKGQPGTDEVEVIVLRGLDTRSYAALVTRLGKSEANLPVMSFADQGDTPVLAEVRASGRSFALAPSETDYAIKRAEPDLEAPSEHTQVPVSIGLGKE